MTIRQTPLIDKNNGNISVNGREGAYLELQFQTAAGAARDVSASALFFEVDGAFRIALGAGATSDFRTLTITRAQIASIADRAHRYVFIDETSSVPSVFLTGNIAVTGFTAQPA